MQRVLVGSLLAACAGCHLAFPIDADDVPPPNGDGAPGGDAWFGGWSEPTRVAIDGHGADDAFYVTDPALSGDEELLAFAVWDRTSGGSGELWLAEAAGDPRLWSSATALPFNDPVRGEANPKLSDAATLILYSYQSGTVNNVDIRAWSRADRGATVWGEVSLEQTTGLNSIADDRPGTPRVALDRIIVHRRDDNTGNHQMTEYVRAGATGPWLEAPGDPMAAVNALGNVVNAHLSEDGLAIVFALFQAGTDFDLHGARRPDVDAAFGDIEPLAGVNSGAGDVDPWLSKDGRRLWFARIEGGLPTAEWGIYYSQR